MSSYEPFSALETNAKAQQSLSPGPGLGLPTRNTDSLAARSMAQSDVNDIRMSNTALLKAIASGDWLTYSLLVDDRITCFEPEACGKLIKGKAFHKHYFDLGQTATRAPALRNETICDEAIRIIGNDTALATYVRIVQTGTSTTSSEETRVWQRSPDAQTLHTALGKWKLVHFHRSHPKAHYSP